MRAIYGRIIDAPWRGRFQTPDRGVVENPPPLGDRRRIGGKDWLPSKKWRIETGYGFERLDGVQVEQVLWRNNESNVEVELVAIHGGGHGIPQPYRRRPRLLGPSPKEPNGPAVIWAFFERQRPR